MWAGRIVCIQTSNDKEVFNDTTYSLYTTFKFGGTIQQSNYENAHGLGLDTTFWHSKGRYAAYTQLISRVIACFIGPSIYSILLMYIFSSKCNDRGILLEQKGSILFHQHFTKQGKTSSIYILKCIRNSHFFNRQGPVSACQTKCAHGVSIRLALLSRHLYQLDIRDSSLGSLPSDTVRMFKHCLSFVAQD